LQGEHIRDEVALHISRRAATKVRSITPTKDDIIVFLPEKRKEDTMPDAIGEILEEEIIQKILDTVLEMCIGNVDI